jgi:hypothetical protein
VNIAAAVLILMILHEDDHDIESNDVTTDNSDNGEFISASFSE